jgi:membrane protein
MPKGLYSVTARTIFDIISRPRADILSFGFLFTVFASTNGMTSLMRAFNMALHTREKRTYLKARLIGFLLMILLLFVQITAILMLLVGNLLIRFLSNRNWQLGESTSFQFLKDDLNYFLVEFFRYGSVFLIFYLAICIIYYFGPAVSKKFRFFNFGALIATLLCILITNGLSYFITTANTYNKLYGSIGSLIGLMIWVYLLSLTLILGFEINTSLREAYFEEKAKKAVL